MASLHFSHAIMILIINFLSQQLHEMFKDLALMVEQQGEMLNNIEKNVDQAREYVQDAERECHQAVDLTNKWRRVRMKTIRTVG